LPLFHFFPSFPPLSPFSLLPSAPFSLWRIRYAPGNGIWRIGRTFRGGLYSAAVFLNSASASGKPSNSSLFPPFFLPFRPGLKPFHGTRRRGRRRKRSARNGSATLPLPFFLPFPFPPSPPPFLPLFHEVDITDKYKVNEGYHGWMRLERLFPVLKRVLSLPSPPLPFLSPFFSSLLLFSLRDDGDIRDPYRAGSDLEGKEATRDTTLEASSSTV